ncbi:MAG: flagellin hook IN motif-containing protein, partial [Thiohalorhabdaceae bacterium]
DGSSQLTTVSYDDSADYDNDGDTGDTSDLVAALNSQLDKVSASQSGNTVTLEPDTGHRFAIENDPGNLFSGQFSNITEETVAMERGSSNLFAATGVDNFFTMTNGTEAAHQTGPFDTIRSAEGLTSANQALNLAGDFTLSDGASSATVNVSQGDSLNDLASAINGLGLNITASVNSDNQLSLDADSGSEITFEADTAGVMDRLGLAEGNSGATEIAVDPAVAESPKRVAAGYLGERLDDQGNRVADSS